jgi:hypothetical protein
VKSVLGVVAVGVLILVVMGCQAYSIDPTEQFFPISIKNDLSRAVVVSYCKDTRCGSLGDSWTLSPATSAQDSISDRGVFTRYRVTALGGRPLGCLPLQFTHAYEDVVVHIS